MIQKGKSPRSPDSLPAGVNLAMSRHLSVSRRQVQRQMPSPRVSWIWSVQEVDRLVETAIATLRRMPYQAYLRTAHWQRRRALALERADHACEICGHDDRLEVHHRTYARVDFEWPEDLIALCKACHTDHHRALVLHPSERTAPAGRRRTPRWP
jgi:hypothetical protein